MKWFMALNQDAPIYPLYVELVKVAVHSAKLHTHLEPYFLFDGAPCELTDWLGRQGVTVIYRRWKMLGRFQEVATRANITNLLGYAAGVFLRMEIPALFEEQGWTDKEAFYTDCDIMFTGDPEPLFPSLFGRYFGAAPESDPSNLADINSGVMVMRLPAMIATDAAFQEFVGGYLESCAYAGDQVAYRTFYRHGWTSLPVELNWKPYWGNNPAARIVHFQGPKPFFRSALATGKADEAHRRLAHGGFDDYCAMWDRFLTGANERH